ALEKSCAARPPGGVTGEHDPCRPYRHETSAPPFDPPVTATASSPASAKPKVDLGPPPAVFGTPDHPYAPWNPLGSDLCYVPGARPTLRIPGTPEQFAE